ncbi:hypothetical protein THSYN_24995 [Candidatus Thiodictyon syntrophicum]|uniref:WavE lipopolysaccharide synthesis n=1 Tax=Candidatus Thiodictyon syntrophicum TaxID=1166950 RepID=A0A2K8UE58_9GAMM|nr:hypothetical protein THSYN_24995 [Candidatus Thiodictyon syntrophicum]
MHLSGHAYSDVTFVIQGAIAVHGRENITIKCIESIKRYYSKASIIVSTWTDPGPIDGVVIIVNEDPGPIQTSDPFFLNYNRMMKSTAEGIARSKTRYVAKIRSDFWFGGFYPILEEFSKQCFIDQIKYPLLSAKIMMCMQRRHYRLYPFYISDWFNFGCKEDMQKLWNGRLVETSRVSCEASWIGRLIYESIGCSDSCLNMDHLFHSEQQLCLGFLKAVGVKVRMTALVRSSIFDLLESYYILGELFCVVDRNKLNLISKKHLVDNRQDNLYIWNMAVKAADSFLARSLVTIQVIYEYLQMEVSYKSTRFRRVVRRLWSYVSNL